MRSDVVLPLASTVPDVGPGSVWPTALLCSTVSSAVFAAGAWVGVEACGIVPVFSFSAWVAVHALFGLGVGLAVTVVLSLGRRIDPALHSSTAARAAAVRLSVFGVALGVAAFAMLSRAALVPLLSSLTAMGASCAGLLLLAKFWLRRIDRLFALPRLDPLRVAGIVAFLLVPLHDGSMTASLGAAWAVMLRR
ncbi:MAG: hypothetical protein IT454_15385 [Planctomycetes bacterium]|nr:hypothetical protein [Planctomycetota bacterium]